MKIFTRKHFIFLFAIVFCSCSDSTSGPEVVSNVLVDSRDSQTNKTIEIGGRVWMAENLNYQEKQGRLYLWNEAMVACPNGWELPSKADFDNLIASVGGFENAVDLFRAFKAGIILWAITVFLTSTLIFGRATKCGKIMLAA